VKLRNPTKREAPKKAEAVVGNMFLNKIKEANAKKE
jgi:hypothetical protein